MGLFTKAALTIARGLGLQDPRLYAHFGAVESDAGERVSVDASLQIGTVWACVRLIAQTIATLPFPVYRTDANGHGVPAPDHPLYRLLHDKPNADMTAVEFWEVVLAHVLLWGNAYVAISRNGSRIVALTPMRPDFVVVRRETDGTLTYTYTWAGRTETLSEDDVLHIKGFSLDGYMGLSAIAQARNTLGSARAAERSSGAFFRNGMRPSGILKAPTYLTQPQREDAKVILANFKGASQTGGTPLLEGGWDWEALAIPPEEAQLLATRQFHVEEICRWFDTPPIMVGHMGDSSRLGSSTAEVMLHFYKTCLRNHIKRIEQAVNGKLLTPADLQRGIYAEINIEGILRADSAARASYYSTMVQNGLMTRNEVRALENLPRVDGGDELTVQQNMIGIEDLANAVAAKLPSPKSTSPQNGSSAPIPEIKQ